MEKVSSVGSHNEQLLFYQKALITLALAIKSSRYYHTKRGKLTIVIRGEWLANR